MEQSVENVSQGMVNYNDGVDEEEDEKSIVSDERRTRSHRKKKSHHKIKSRQSSVSAVLEGLEEDVLEVGQAVTVEGDISHNIVMEQNISERLFVQNKKGFEPVTRDKVFQETFHNLSQSQEVEIEKEDLSPHEFAIYMYHKTRLFFSFCHGILGGFGIAHISLVFSITDNPEAVQSFAEGYPDFARVVQILYYILSAICFVSVLDRCDFAGLRLVHCLDFMRYRIADVLTIILYFGLLVTTVLCIQWDDRLALSVYNEDLWKDPDISHSEFIQWRILSLVRGFLAVAGYITMFFGPGDDLFFVHLYNMMRNEQKANDSHKARH